MDNTLELYKKILEINHLPGIFFAYKVILDGDNKVDIKEGNIKEYDLSTLSEKYKVMNKRPNGNHCAIKINSPNLYFIDHSSNQFLLRLGSETEDFENSYNCHCNKEELKLLSAFYSFLVTKAVSKLYPKRPQIQFK